MASLSSASQTDSPTPAIDVAIIGAGTAGCVLAQQLHKAGLKCLLIEKSRGLGGRCSRRGFGHDHSIDLGAPAFEIDHHADALLHEQLNSWCEDGSLSVWNRTPKRFDESTSTAAALTTEQTKSFCASPSMNAWHKQLAVGVDVLTGTRVSELKKQALRWHLLDEQGQLITSAHKVVITAPAEQTADLLKRISDLPVAFSRCQAASKQSQPQYVCAIAFSQPLDIEADLLRGGHPVLGAAIRENTKPGRVHPLGDVWVLHSTHEWAQAQGGKPYQEAADELSQAFCRHVNTASTPQFLTSHYWRLARHTVTASPTTPQTTAFIWHENLQLGCCGDWLSSGDIYGALTSALGLSQCITQTSAIEG